MNIKEARDLATKIVRIIDRIEDNIISAKNGETEVISIMFDLAEATDFYKHC